MPSFEQFLMFPLNARSILMNLSLKNKKASNRPKNIGVFTRTKTSRSDERLPIGYSLSSFKRFLMTPLSARSTLVNFTGTKKLTSNGSKPMGVLTRTECSYSDDRLPLGYLLLDFQQI